METTSEAFHERVNPTEGKLSSTTELRGLTSSKMPDTSMITANPSLIALHSVPSSPKQTLPIKSIVERRRSSRQPPVEDILTPFTTGTETYLLPPQRSNSNLDDGENNEEISTRSEPKSTIKLIPLRRSNTNKDICKEDTGRNTACDREDEYEINRIRPLINQSHHKSNRRRELLNETYEKDNPSFLSSESSYGNKKDIIRSGNDRHPSHTGNGTNQHKDGFFNAPTLPTEAEIGRKSNFNPIPGYMGEKTRGLVVMAAAGVASIHTAPKAYNAYENAATSPRGMTRGSRANSGINIGSTVTSKPRFM
jgi:hypothetical protein